MDNLDEKLRSLKTQMGMDANQPVSLGAEQTQKEYEQRFSDKLKEMKLMEESRGKPNDELQDKLREAGRYISGSGEETRHGAVEVPLTPEQVRQIAANSTRDQVQAAANNPNDPYSEVAKAILDGKGEAKVKWNRDAVAKQYESLDDAKVKEIADEQNNPWAASAKTELEIRKAKVRRKEESALRENVNKAAPRQRDKAIDDLIKKRIFGV